MKDTLHFKALTQKNCYAVSSLTEDTLFVDWSLRRKKSHLLHRLFLSNRRSDRGKAPFR